MFSFSYDHLLIGCVFVMHSLKHTQKIDLRNVIGLLMKAPSQRFTFSPRAAGSHIIFCDVLEVPQLPGEEGDGKTLFCGSNSACRTWDSTCRKCFAESQMALLSDPVLYSGIARQIPLAACKPCMKRIPIYCCVSSLIW